MTDNFHRVERRRLKRSLQAGDELAFSPVHFSGDKVLSHTIRYERGRYRVRGVDEMGLGSFATFAAASRAGLQASAMVQGSVSVDERQDQAAFDAFPGS